MRAGGACTYGGPAAVPRMPPGLERLLEGLAKEVIRNNPTDVYDFCANHMLDLLKLRTGSGVKCSLTLEEKISIPQERVRHRAKQRCQRYDQLVQFDEGKFVTKSEENNQAIEVRQVTQVYSTLDRQPGDSSHMKMSADISEDENEFEIDSDIMIGGKMTEDEMLSRRIFNENNSNFSNEKSNENVTGELIDIAQHHIGSTKGTLLTIETKFEDVDLTDLDDQEDFNQERDKHFQIVVPPFNSNHILRDENIEKNTDIKSDSNGDNMEVDLQESERNDVETNAEGIYVVDSNLSNTFIRNDIDVFETNNTLPDDGKKGDVNVTINSGPIVNNSDGVKEPVPVDIVASPVDMDKVYSNDIKKDHKKHSNQVLENVDFNVETPLNLRSTVDNEVEVYNDMDKMCKSKDFCDESQSQSKNLQNLFVKENEGKLQDRQLFEENLNTHNNILEASQLSNLQNKGNNLNHIHESGKMNLETAAITIQKVFRNFLFKSRASTYDEETNDDSNTLEETSDSKEDSEYSMICANLVKDRRPLGNMRMDTVLQTVNEEKSLSLSTDDSSTLSSAATIIQAHVRGFLVRNKLSSLKTSTNSLVNANGPNSPSTEGDLDVNKSKTPLNIHIVPESEHFLSRDESMIVSMDLSLDGSPPTSINLHPLGYDKSERRKLKREDAVQSFSPPTNNSGKLSEDVDSVKEAPLKIVDPNSVADNDNKAKDLGQDYIETEVSEVPLRESTPDGSCSESNNDDESMSSQLNTVINNESRKESVTISSDQTDVVTPFSTTPASTPTLSHTGEFHDVVLPTKVSRGDTTVVRECKNVLVYFLLWNNS